MSRRAVIVGGGSFPEKAYPLYILSSADIVVCCDGAVRTYISNCGKMPDMVIGDMDSVPQDFLDSYEGKWMRVPDQETNDQTKAFEWLMANYSDLDAIYFIGSTGKRADHTIANLSLLMEYAERTEAHIEAVGDYGCAFPLTDSCSFSCGEGRKVSIFSPDSTLRIASKGLKWPTDAVVFDNWWKASLNVASQDEVNLSFNHPSKVLVILD